MSTPTPRITPRRLRGALLDALAAHDEPTALRLLATLDADARFDLAVAAQRLAELAEPAVAAPARFAPRAKRQHWTPRRAATAVTLGGAVVSWLALAGYWSTWATAILFTIAPFLPPKLRQLWSAKFGHTSVSAPTRTPRPAR